MDGLVAHGFGNFIAERMTAEHRMLASRWLDRLNAVLPVEPNDVFPTHDLLDHVPALILEIAAYLRQPEREEFAANASVVEKARQLGELRYEQRASVHQLLREYRILGGILAAFVREEASRIGAEVDAEQAIALLASLYQAVSVLQQTTVDTFITKYTETIAAQTQRLEGFNRMVSHELRQPLTAVQFAVRLLQSDPADPSHRARHLAVIDRNVMRLMSLTDQLARLSRLKPADDTVQTQYLELGLIVREVARQLREMADSRGVEIVVRDPFPAMTVEVAAVELALVNLVANAVKYSDPAKTPRFVEISAETCETTCTIVVHDNGIGIPAAHVDRVFERAFRAHASRDGELGTDGFGLGLSIVADCVAGLGGRITAESTEGEGTTFRVMLPRSTR
jgi:signal transduction histidine kinase